MTKLRALVVDDEPLARQRIRELLSDAPDVEVIGECGNGREALNAIRARRPDLVFLDVQMPELNGFDVLQELEPRERPTVIFVTAFDEFALKAFDVHALDYLLKPFDRERFQRALDRARAARRENGSIDARLSALLSELGAGRKYLNRMLVKTGSRTVFLKSAEIDWIEAAGNYVRIYVGRERYLLRETMTALESKLDPEMFLRIHRSTIVNLERIREFEPYFHGDYIVKLQDGRQLTLSRTYRDRLEERLGRSL